MKRQEPAVIMHVLRPSQGGMKESVLQMIETLDRASFSHVIVGPLETPEMDRMNRIGARTEPLEIDGVIRPVSDIRTVFRLTELIRRYRPNLVHAHGYKAGLLSSFARLRAPEPVPGFITIHNFLPKAGKPFVLRAARKVMLLEHTRFIAVSGAVSGQIETAFGIPPDRISVIMPAIHLPEISPDLQEVAELREGKFLICCAARLIPSKGVDCLLKALRLLARGSLEYKVVVPGDGPERERLRLLSRQLEVDQRITWLGQIPRHQALKLIGASNLFVLPSLAEGLPLSVMEAMHLGTPVVATAVGGIPEMIVDYRTGRLVPPAEPEALAGAIEWCASHPAELERIASEAKSFAADHFSLESSRRALEQLYRSMIDASRV